MKKRWSGLLWAFSALTLAGCAGVSSNQAPSVQFNVPLTVEQVFERAMAQTKYCLATDDSASIVSKMADDKRSAQIQVLLRFSRILAAEIDMQALNAHSTQVDVLMWGASIWDQTAADAMQAAIQFGVPSCINYFPGPSPSPQSNQR